VIGRWGVNSLKENSCYGMLIEILPSLIKSNYLSSVLVPGAISALSETYSTRFQPSQQSTALQSTMAANQSRTVKGIFHFFLEIGSFYNSPRGKQLGFTIFEIHSADFI